MSAAVARHGDEARARRSIGRLLRKSLLALAAGSAIASAPAIAQPSAASPPTVAPTVAPYGEWASPIAAAQLAGGLSRYSELQSDGDALYWIEMLPSERRYAVMRRAADGAVAAAIPAPFSALSRVHEYGGGAFTVVDGVVYFTNARDQQLWRAAPGDAPRAVTNEPGARFANCAADRPRSRLLCVREDHRVPGEARNELVAVALADGATRVLFHEADFVASPTPSPDGRRVAFLAWRHPNMPWDDVQLLVADVAGDGGLAAPTVVNAGVAEAAMDPAWGPDGRLYFVGDRSGWWNLLRWDGRRVAPVTRERVELGFPGWELGRPSWAFLPDGRIVAAFNDGGTEGLALVDPRRGTFRRVPGDFVAVRGLAVHGGAVYFQAGFRDRLHALLELTPATGARRVLRTPDAATLEAGDVSLARPIRYPTGGGTVAHAFYYPPANARFRAPAGSRPPLIVIAHGGPTSHTTPAFNVGTQYWTSRGFAVLDLNYRGSSGFGRAYRRSLYGHIADYDVEDAVRGAKHVAATGLADPERLLIRGNSAGGLIVLAALAFHDVFRAGADYFGVSDLEALRADTHKFESRYAETLVGPWPAARDVYRARSPIHSLDGIRRPLIVFQGLQDKVVPPDQSERIVAAVRSRGVPVAYVTFPDEAHGFRSLEANVKAREAELSFYGRVLGFRPAGALPDVAIENLPPPAAASPPAPATGDVVPAPASDDTRVQAFDFRSRLLGRTYRVRVSVPWQPAPEGGYPVVYLLDGTMYFRTVVESAALQSLNVIRPPVIVAIGYPTDDIRVALSRRNRDLTTPVTAEFLAGQPLAAPPGSRPEEFGDVDAFLRMIDEEVKPLVESRVKVDRGDQTLMGHSLGGFTTLRALFTRPTSFSTFVAASPSIWWHEREVTRDQRAFREALAAGRIAPRVLITVGAGEGKAVRVRPGGPIGQELLDRAATYARMVENARDLGAELAALRGPPRYRVDVVEFADENHVTVVPASFARGLTFALSRD